MTPTDFDHWATERQQHLETLLSELLPKPGSQPVKLHDAMRYAVLGGGKRVRPLLTYATGLLCGAKAHTLDCAAAALELIHAYSLVHDDLPCMDNWVSGATGSGLLMISNARDCSPSPTSIAVA